MKNQPAAGDARGRQAAIFTAAATKTSYHYVFIFTYVTGLHGDIVYATQEVDSNFVFFSVIAFSLMDPLICILLFFYT